jgi:hypothetical protein
LFLALPSSRTGPDGKPLHQAVGQQGKTNRDDTAPLDLREKTTFPFYSPFFETHPLLPSGEVRWFIGEYQSLGGLE